MNWQYKVEIMRWDNGSLRIEFVECHIQKGRKLHHSMDFRFLRSKEELESWAHLWAITHKVPTDAMLAH